VTRILAVADEVDEALYGDKLLRLRPDLILSSGDLPFEYLENLVSRLDVPLVYVPGNHDRDLSPRDTTWMPLRPEGPPRGPRGADNADRRVVDAAGLRIAGLGGSLRYRDGPNQYWQSAMWRRALFLELRSRLKRARDGRGVDILLTHAPPAGIGDGGDAAHQGFAAFHRLLRSLRPRLLVHGHIHPYGVKQADHQVGPTLVVNAIPSRLIEL
jgi:calcineurin-like phosphoesterase family protein